MPSDFCHMCLWGQFDPAAHQSECEFRRCDCGMDGSVIDIYPACSPLVLRKLSCQSNLYGAYMAHEFWHRIMDSGFQERIDKAQRTNKRAPLNLVHEVCAVLGLSGYTRRLAIPFMPCFSHLRENAGSAVGSRASIC
jgi:hypothetical protein